jgi:hypothetical protein
VINHFLRQDPSQCCGDIVLTLGETRSLQLNAIASRLLGNRQLTQQVAWSAHQDAPLLQSEHCEAYHATIFVNKLRFVNKHAFSTSQVICQQKFHMDLVGSRRTVHMSFSAYSLASVKRPMLLQHHSLLWCKCLPFPAVIQHLISTQPRTVLLVHIIVWLPYRKL